MEIRPMVFVPGTPMWMYAHTALKCAGYVWDFFFFVKSSDCRLK